MSKLRIAVIGAGHLGRIHAKLLGQVDGAELVAISDPIESAREHAAKLVRCADLRRLSRMSSPTSTLQSSRHPPTPMLKSRLIC